MIASLPSSFFIFNSFPSALTGCPFAVTSTPPSSCDAPCISSDKCHDDVCFIPAFEVRPSDAFCFILPVLIPFCIASGVQPFFNNSPSLKSCPFIL